MTSATSPPNRIALLLTAALAAIGLVLTAAERATAVRGTDTITTFAGTGLAPPPEGDGGPATAARLESPNDVAVGPDGSVYVADFGGHRIRRIAPNGVISTVAGTGVAGFGGDGGAATAAQLSAPFGVAVDAAGNVYIGDQNNHRIRRVSPGGVITTIAGDGTPAFAGDGGPAADARVSFPNGLDFDAAGNLYIADLANNRIRRIGADGIITTVAGNGTAGFGGDGGPATAGALQFPTDVEVGPNGDLYIADQSNDRVRLVNPAGVITTLAGIGTEGFSGDGGPAALAQLDTPLFVATDLAGNVYVSDAGNSRVRRIAPDSVILTVAGNGTSAFAGDGGPAQLAQLSARGIEVQGDGSLLLADTANRRVRRVVNVGPAAAIAAAPESGFAPLAVSFDGRGSADPGGALVAFAWDFGDGARADGPVAAHTYGAPGTYTARLTVMDDSGAQATTTRAIAVAAVPPPPPPQLTLSGAVLRPRWRVSRLAGRLEIRGAASRPARVRLEVLGRVGRRTRVVQRRTLSLPAGAFTRRVALRIRPAPARLPLRYTIRLRETAPPAGEAALPTRTRTALLRPPRAGVVSRAFVSRQIGGRPTRGIRAGTGILFAHFDLAAAPRRLRMRAIWRPPGSRPLTTVVRRATPRRALSFLRSRSGALPRGTYRVELRAGRVLIARTAVRIR